MKLVLAFTMLVAALMALAIYDHEGARPAQAPSLFDCRAPTVEGELTMITVDVRAGQLVGRCQYASTRPSKPKKGG